MWCRSSRRRYAFAAALAASATGACTGNTAPPGFLPAPEMAGRSVRGGWIQLEVRSGPGLLRFHGELLAISPESLWIRVLPDSGYVIGKAAVSSGKITWYDAPTNRVVGNTALGVLSSITNGWLLIVTAPAWVLTGTFSRYGDLRAAERDLPADFDRREVDLSAVARFPQGIPRGMDLSFRRLPRPD
jgi:hypothetical protein